MQLPDPVAPVPEAAKSRPAPSASKSSTGASSFPATQPVVASLRRRADFGRVLREGRRSRQRTLSIAARPNQLDVVRVGYAVGRRVGGAVVRNRVRRRLRALIRAAVPSALERVDGRATLAAAGAGWDIVVTALVDSSRTPFDALAGEVASALGGALAGARTTGRVRRRTGEPPGTAGAR